MNTFQFRNLRNIEVDYHFQSCYLKFTDQDGLINEYRVVGFPNLLPTHIEVQFIYTLSRPGGEVIKVEPRKIYKEYEWQQFAQATNLPISILHFGYTQAINGLTRRLAAFEGTMENQGGHRVYGFDGKIIQPVTIDLLSTTQETITALVVDGETTYTDNQDGSLEVAAVNGIAPFRYKIGETGVWQSTGLFSGLSAGSYEVIVEDSLLTQRLIQVAVPKQLPEELTSAA